MKIIRSERGFEFLDHEVYPQSRHDSRLASQSSAIHMEYEGAGTPGSSYLWIGEHHHLNREQVKQFTSHLVAWLDTGSLEIGE